MALTMGQDGGTMTPPISSFTGPYRFLSNFYIEPDGTHVEGEFQAQKCAVPADVDRFRSLNPEDARWAGRRVVLRLDWEDVKVETMRALVWQKFVDHPELAERLLSTGEAELVEGNTHGDVFWGVCQGKGANTLGRILMETRTLLRDVGSITR